jgi:hypothetical protein
VLVRRASQTGNLTCRQSDGGSSLHFGLPTLEMASKIVLFESAHVYSDERRVSKMRKQQSRSLTASSV